MQLLPDQEITASYYASAAELLAAAPGLVGRRQQEARQWQHTVAHAAAVSSEQHWQLYENARLDLTVTGGVTQTREVTQLCHMSHEAGLENKLSHSVAVHEREAMSEAVRLVAELQQDRASEPAVREAYRRRREAFRVERERALRRCGVDLVDVRTDRPYDLPLLKFFKMRERKAGRG